MEKVIRGAINMKKSTKVASLVLLDVFFINLAFLLSVYIHYEGDVSSEVLIKYVQLIVMLLPFKLMIYKMFTLYNSLWEYASIEELIKVVGAITIANIVSVTYMIIMGMPLFFGIYFVAVLFEMAFVGGGRFSYRFFRRLRHHRNVLKQNYDRNVLVVGCGSTASMIATEIKNHPDTYGQVVGYVDDDNSKIGKSIAGIKVLGNRHDIYGICKRYSIDEIILAIPTLTKQDVREVLSECKRTGAKVKIIPGIMEIIDGKVSMSQIREVEIEDLLGRDTVDLNVQEIATYIEDKTILVTGGGGSIGSELCRQIVKYNPKQLVILDIYENNAYDIQNELLRQYGSNLNLDVIIASVRDRECIFHIIKELQPDVIFHAAAHKHVPLMERAPSEALKNNVFGTKNVAEAAHEAGVERFVLISTDKAVNPTNVMGASKRMCEMIIQGLSKHSQTKYVAVRFGNVLGSNGSVIPLFKQQIKEGGPVTVTHREIVRYFMTIPEAAQLVIQAGAIASGGEIFILDMGEPVKIYDLAIDLVRLSGLEPHEDIDIKVTGLRPGEKLYEELLMSEEGLTNTKCKKIYVGSPGEIDYAVLKKSFKQLEQIMKTNDQEEIIDMIQLMVPTYMPNQEINMSGQHKTENSLKYKMATKKA